MLAIFFSRNDAPAIPTCLVVQSLTPETSESEKSKSLPKDRYPKNRLTGSEFCSRGRMAVSEFGDEKSKIETCCYDRDPITYYDNMYVCA